MTHRAVVALQRLTALARMKRAAIPVAIMLAVASVTACDPRGSAGVEQLLKRAQEQRSGGNIRASVIELKNALQKDPQNAGARLALGQAFVDLGDAASAEIELRRALELGAESDRAKLLLGETRILQGRFDLVLRDFPVAESAPPAAKAASLALRGRAHMALGQRVQAEEAFKAALSLDEKSVDALLGLARLSFAIGNATAGKEFLGRAAAAAPEDVKVLALQGDTALAAKDFGGAENHFKQILKLRKDDVAALNAQLGVARAQIAAGKVKDAAARLTQILKIAPNDPMTNYLRALAAYQGKEYQLAKTHSEIVLRNSPNHRPSLFLAGGANYALGQYEQAYSHLNAYLAAVPNNVEARKLLAATQMRMGQASKAIGTLQSVAEKPEAADSQVLAMIGAASSQAGDNRSALRYLEKAVAKEPENPQLRTRLGAAQVALGNVEDGMEELEKAAELDPDGKADIALILAHLRVKEYEKALEAAKKLQEKQPKNPNGWTLAGMAEIGRGNDAAAKAAFQHALQIKPDDRNATKNLAALAVGANDFDQARKVYDEFLRQHPGDVETLVLYSQLEARAGRPKEGLGRLEEAVRLNPESEYARITLARVYLLAGDPAKALSAAQPVQQKNPLEPAVLELVGRAQLASGQTEISIGTFRDLVNVRPESPEAHLYLANAYEAAGRIDQAVTQTETALRFAKDSPQVRFQYARLLARAGKVDRAAPMLQELKASFPNDPGIADLEGALALATNKPADAVTAYGRLLGMQENNFNLLKLARAQNAAGQAAAASETINQWLARFPEDLVVRTALADSLLGRQQFAEAANEYQRILKGTPDSVVTLNNLAWSLAKAGKPAEAVPHAERAATLAPNAPAVLDTYGVVLTSAGRAKDAVRVLRTAAQQAPKEPSIHFHLAQALAKDGQGPAARDVLKGLLGSGADWPDKNEAEALLKQLGG
jgi:putative PEP-CTERM system TPR-repeat lipoprotein